MQITKTHKIVAFVVLVVVLLGIYMAFSRKSNVGSTDNKTNDISTTTTDSNGVTYKIEPVSNSDTKEAPKPIPDLDRKVSPSANAVVSNEDSLSSTQKVKDLQAILKRDPTNFPVWMDLAMYQKLGGDYDGAIISWKYAGKLRPADSVSVANIGNLYAYQIKDNTQAEIYYKQAIAISPTQPYLYSQLADIYKDLFRDISKARVIIEQGLSKNPVDEVLLQYRASLK